MTEAAGGGAKNDSRFLCVFAGPMLEQFRQKNDAGGSLQIKMRIYLSQFIYKKVYYTTEGMLVYNGMCFFIP